MRPASRFPRRHAVALVLAGIACLAQSLGGLLPEPVVCLRDDRPASGELFFRACSCRHEGHELADPGGPAARRIEPGCVDVHLAFPALLAAGAGIPGAVSRLSQPVPMPVGVHAPAPAFSAPAACRPGWGGSPPAGSPLPLPGLRC